MIIINKLFLCICLLIFIVRIYLTYPGDDGKQADECVNSHVGKVHFFGKLIFD